MYQNIKEDITMQNQESYMLSNELSYKALIRQVLIKGIEQKGRNGNTIELFGTSLTLDVSNNKLPLIACRKMYPKGIIGEFLAFIQSDCKSLDDFESRGCNYWKLWADEDDNLSIDYPPGNQLDDIIENIKRDPHSRRHIIDLWNHQNLSELSLPCCHYSYQFNIERNKINMIWTQRSADIMIGVPSDMVLATLYLHIVGNATGYKPNRIIMNFGSTHIYEEHLKDADTYLKRECYSTPKIHISKVNYKHLIQEDFHIRDYVPQKPIKFELKG